MSEAAEIEYAVMEGFAGPVRAGILPPAVFGSPQRYVQGEGVIDLAGHYLSRLNIKSVAVLLSLRSQRAEGRRLLDSIESAGIACQLATFGGECSLEEIDGHTAVLRGMSPAPDAVVAIGGGKAVDAGKAIAHRLGVRSVVVPSLASSDAPCAAVSVIYTAQGVTQGAELYDENPALVLVDTGVIAHAGERYLVAGMGDAMATWYEARACELNPAGITAFGGRPTLAGGAIARLCADTIYEHGHAALDAVRVRQVSPALERVVEANTLLSGLGYESGGLAASHAFAQGFTVLDSVHQNFLHGEMVAMGIVAQLMLESSMMEAERVVRFFLGIGLPVHLGHLGLSIDDGEGLGAVVQAALTFPFIGNMAVETSTESLYSALCAAHEFGCSVAASEGDAPYRALH